MDKLIFEQPHASILIFFLVYNILVYTIHLF